MQKIHLTDFKTANDEYSVYLGNGTTHKFPSKKLCDRFLTNTGKFLTTELYELHGIFDVLQHKFNDSWTYMDQEPVKARKIREELQAAETSFENSISSQYRSDGNSWVFLHLHKANCCLKLVIKQLERENFRRSLAHERYQLDGLFKRLQVVEQDLNTYGQRTADIISIPQHISMQAAG
jgi:hypothetical protein